MSVKKILGAAGILACILLLILVGMNVITWRLFWVVLIFIGGFAYFVLPRMEE